MNANQSLPQLPQTSAEFTSWAQVEPYVQALLATKLTADTSHAWLTAWTQLANLVIETRERLWVATTVNTADQTVEQRYHAFLANIQPAWLTTDQQLKQQLLTSGLQPSGLEVTLQGMRAEAQLFCEANLPLLAEEQKLANEYNRIVGAQTVLWEGRDLRIDQLRPVYQNPERSIRERAWRLASSRQLADRAALNELWIKLLPLRQQIAANAGYADYRAYTWHRRQRFDYTPADCFTFHAAIGEVVVPAAKRIHARRRQQLGVAMLRPWDLDVDPQGRPPLRPFADVAELERKTAAIFQQLDPGLSTNFERMRQERLLDLAPRKQKAALGYCVFFPLTKCPFIFWNSAGLPGDVLVLLHEAGHSFHYLEAGQLPYHQQYDLVWDVAQEIAEVASMAMELLAAPYLSARKGGFYTDADTARARVEHLHSIIDLWPSIAVADAFQHWVYTNPDAALNPANCDAQWEKLWQHYMGGVAWDGLEEVLITGWQRIPHLFLWPFYCVEYGLAQLGAVQIWRNSLRNQADAIARYRQALALGRTASIPQLYAAAGAKFAFDAVTLGEAVTLIEQTIDKLETN